MSKFLPDDMMNAEDDQLLAKLGDLTMRYEGLSSPTAVVADVLDPVDADGDDLMGLMVDPRKREVLLCYAKLGRNAFLRHWDATSPPIDD